MRAARSISARPSSFSRSWTMSTPPLERRPQQRLGVVAAGPRLADEVEARGAQPLAAQRAGAPRAGARLIARLWLGAGLPRARGSIGGDTGAREG